MIEWKPTQRNLGVPDDGIPGRATFTAMFKHMGGAASPAVLRSLGNAMAVHAPIYGAMTSRERLADFLAQTANETGGYTRFEEGLRYSAKRLVEVWPKRYPTIAAATPYANNPEKLANHTYANRMGNGDGASGDGWAYRGRGMLQLTGLDNYEATDRRLGIGLDTDPDLAAVPALSLLIALDFYKENKVWERLDAGDTTGARRITNGGKIGLADVNALRKRALAVIV